MSIESACNMGYWESFMSINARHAPAASLARRRMTDDTFPDLPSSVVFDFEPEGPLMPNSCTRTNCEFGASSEDDVCAGRSNTTLGMKLLRMMAV